MMNPKRQLASSIGSVFFLASLFFVSPVRAVDPADLIDVVEIVGTTPIIVETNILPGDSFARTITVKNFTAEPQDIIIKLDIDTTQGIVFIPNFELERMLLASFKRGDNSLVTLPGGGTEASLRSLDGTVVSLGSVPAGGTEPFTLGIVFDKNAGNEYQNTKVYFDLSMSVDVADVTTTVATDNNGGDGNGGGGGNNNRNRNPGPNPPVGPAGPAFAGATTPGEDAVVSGDETGLVALDDESPEVLGVSEGICIGGWPLWAWILLLIAHTGVTNMKRIFRQLVIQRWGTTVQAGSALGALVVWYIFDPCREYWPSVPIAIAVISGVSLLLFRHWRKASGG